MRAKKAKAMRKADPSRPNPGRLHGGANKHEAKTGPPKGRSMRGFKRWLKGRQEKRAGVAEWRGGGD